MPLDLIHPSTCHQPLDPFFGAPFRICGLRSSCPNPASLSPPAESDCPWISIGAWRVAVTRQKWIKRVTRVWEGYVKVVNKHLGSPGVGTILRMIVYSLFEMGSVRKRSCRYITWKWLWSRSLTQNWLQTWKRWWSEGEIKGGCKHENMDSRKRKDSCKNAAKWGMGAWVQDMLNRMF